MQLWKEADDPFGALRVLIGESLGDIGGGRDSGTVSTGYAIKPAKQERAARDRPSD
jgi:hypothetical protein